MKSEKKRQLGAVFYGSSILFLVIALILMVQQTNLLWFLFNTQFPISWPNAILLLSNDNWLDILMNKAMNAGILVAVVLVLEILLFIGLILFYLIRFFLVKRKEKWQVPDYFFFIGFLVLLIGSLVCGGMVISEILQTATTIQTNFQRVSPAELKKLTDQLTVFLNNYTFSINTIFGDISTIIQQVKQLFANLQQVAATPKLLQQLMDTLLTWRSYFAICFLVSSIGILIGQILRLRKTHPKLFTFSRRRQTAEINDINERLVQVLEQQQVLLEKIEAQVTYTEIKQEAPLSSVEEKTNPE